MKKRLIFFLGMITGAILTFVVLLMVAKASNASNGGVEYFAEAGEVMDAQSYKVFQVVENGNALATALSDKEYGWYHGIVVLLVAGEDSNYYDEQIVTAPAGTYIRQVGTYRYKTNEDFIKTVPAVAICSR